MNPDYQIGPSSDAGFSYRVAGIGTRFLAALVDGLIIFGIEILVVLLSLVVYLVGASSAAVILGLTLSFILFWGYFIYFETTWNGQTPGKRMMKIRVVKTSGEPISFIDAVVRNLIRVVDNLPFFYGLGLLSMFISKQSRRLGDFAAGTLVVKERSSVTLRDVETSIVRSRAGMPRLGGVDPDELEWNLDRLTDPDVQIVNDFLDRAQSLNREAKDRLAASMTSRVTDQIGARQPLDPIRFLHRVAFLKQARPVRGEDDPDELQWDVKQLSQDDLDTINEFLDRAPRLDGETRQQLGEKMAAQVAERIDAREPLDPVKFLDRVVYLASTGT
jgi:uncharacterized RDD family membrane protein YckC